jgi:hypothetical protein
MEAEIALRVEAERFVLTAHPGQTVTLRTHHRVKWTKRAAVQTKQRYVHIIYYLSCYHTAHTCSESLVFYWKRSSCDQKNMH